MAAVDVVLQHGPDFGHQGVSLFVLPFGAVDAGQLFVEAHFRDQLDGRFVLLDRFGDVSPLVGHPAQGRHGERIVGPGHQDAAVLALGGVQLAVTLVQLAQGQLGPGRLFVGRVARFHRPLHGLNGPVGAAVYLPHVTGAGIAAQIGADLIHAIHHLHRLVVVA